MQAFLSCSIVVSREQLRCIQFCPSCALSSAGTSSADWCAAWWLAGLPLGLALPELSLFSLAGDVHIAIMDRSGQLEVEVIEARGLTPKPGSKSLPGEAEQLGEGLWK